MRIKDREENSRNSSLFIADFAILATYLYINKVQKPISEVGGMAKKRKSSKQERAAVFKNRVFRLCFRIEHHDSKALAKLESLPISKNKEDGSRQSLLIGSSGGTSKTRKRQHRNALNAKQQQAFFVTYAVNFICGFCLFYLWISERHFASNVGKLNRTI